MGQMKTLACELPWANYHAIFMLDVTADSETDVVISTIIAFNGTLNVVHFLADNSFVEPRFEQHGIGIRDLGVCLERISMLLPLG